MLASVVERESAAGRQVLDGARDEDVPWTRHARDAGTDGHREPGALAVDELTLARMNARADLDSDLTDPIHDVERAANRTGGAVERCVEAVACRVVLYALPSLQCIANDGVMTTNNVRPRPVARCRLVLGRADDVREEDSPRTVSDASAARSRPMKRCDDVDDLGAVAEGQCVRIAGDELELRARDPRLDVATLCGARSTIVRSRARASGIEAAATPP